MAKCMPIVLTTLNNESIFCNIGLIISILKNGDVGQDLEIFILKKGEVTKEDSLLLDSIKSIYPNFKYSFVNMTKYLMKDLQNIGEEYFRMFCPIIFKKYDRCICLESNVLVMGSLKELFDWELKESCIAGVKSLESTWINNTNIKLMSCLELDTLDQYIYSSVLLMNLRKIREMHMFDVNYNLIKFNFTNGFQDIINKICVNHISHLPLYFNVGDIYADDLEEWDTAFYSEYELYIANQFPKILRLYNKNPWKVVNLQISRIWWDYARQVKESFQFKSYKKLAEANNIFGLIDKCLRVEDVIVFGFNKIGTELFTLLRQKGVRSIRCFCDNDSKKQGEIYCGVKVISAEEALACYKKPLVIVVSQVHYQEIDHKLKEMGVLEHNIFCYTKKGIYYYKMLREKYYEDELKEIYFMESEQLQNQEIKSVEELTIKMQNSKHNGILEDLKNKYWMGQWLLKTNKIVKNESEIRW